MAPNPSSTAVDDVVARFLDGTLSAAEWTHEAHLHVARRLLASGSPDEVIAELRVRIPAHNARVGIAPDPGRVGRGFHETVTRYFVIAVAAANPTTDAELVTHPWCQRDAPLRHWSAATLASSEARHGWAAPDLAPLPWLDPITRITDTNHTHTNHTHH